MVERISQKLKEITIFSSKNSVCLIAILLSICIFIHELNELRKKEYIYLKKTDQNLIMALIPGDFISNAIERNSFLEKRTTNYLVSNVKPGEVVVECGSNIGYYTNIFAKLVTNTGKVYSYEANRDVMNIANLSLKINGLSDIVTLKNLCISDEYGEIDFSVPTDSEKFLGIPLNKVNLKEASISLDPKAKNTRKVRSVTLDQDLSHLEQIDWLRMGIEGSEVLAIKGAKRLIQSSPNIKIVMEWSPEAIKKYGDISELIDYLFTEGLRAYYINSRGSLGRELSKKDLLNIEIADIVFKRK